MVFRGRAQQKHAWTGKERKREGGGLGQGTPRLACTNPSQRQERKGKGRDKAGHRVQVSAFEVQKKPRERTERGKETAVDRWFAFGTPKTRGMGEQRRGRRGGREEGS